MHCDAASSRAARPGSDFCSFELLDFYSSILLNFHAFVTVEYYTYGNHKSHIVCSQHLLGQRRLHSESETTTQTKMRIFVMLSLPHSVSLSTLHLTRITF